MKLMAPNTCILSPVVYDAVFKIISFGGHFLNGRQHRSGKFRDVPVSKNRCISVCLLCPKCYACFKKCMVFHLSAALLAGGTAAGFRRWMYELVASTRHPMTAVMVLDSQPHGGGMLVVTAINERTEHYSEAEC